MIRKKICNNSLAKITPWDMIFANTSGEQGKTFIHVSTHPSSFPQEYRKSDMNNPYSERTNLASELAHHLVNMHKITPISTTPQKSKACNSKQ